MSISVRSAELCDDVRSEDNGKSLLIGVYSDNVTVGSIPAAMNMKLYLLIGTDGSNTDVEIELEFNRPTIHKMTIPEGFRTANAVIPLSIVMLEEKDLCFRIRRAGGRWGNELRWQFRFSDNAKRRPEAEVAAIEDIYNRNMELPNERVARVSNPTTPPPG